MGTAGCGYYFVNGPHAAEGEGPPGDDRSDIRDSVTWRRKKSHQSVAELLCVGTTCGLATAAVCSETRHRMDAFR